MGEVACRRVTIVPGLKNALSSMPGGTMDDSEAFHVCQKEPSTTKFGYLFFENLRESDSLTSNQPQKPLKKTIVLVTRVPDDKPDPDDPDTPQE